MGIIKLPLTKGLETMIDEEDFALVSRFRWHASKQCDGSHYAVTKVPLHRLIMGFPPVGTFVDHINRDKLDNTRTNLRVCTNAENQQNTYRRNGQSGYKGVHIRTNKTNNPWKVKFLFGGRNYNGGNFPCPIQAAKKYNEMISELAGEFAYLNVIEEETA